MAEGVYPDDVRYHREHDWVRLDGDDAVFGITWYAQDSLGEVVLLRSARRRLPRSRPASRTASSSP